MAWTVSRGWLLYRPGFESVRQTTGRKPFIPTRKNAVLRVDLFLAESVLCHRKAIQ
jgi:hypothetical protein